MLATQSPFVQYFDTDGSPLDGGFVYFGVANQNPETSPVAVYWDAAGTQPAAQPIRTVNGYTVRSGSPATIYAAGNYSLTTRNARGAMVVSVANSAATGNDQLLQDQIDAIHNPASPTEGAALVGFSHANAYAGGVGLALQAFVNVKNAPYNAKGDGVTDDTAAIQAAINTGRSLVFPEGTYSCTALTQTANSQQFVGIGNAILRRRGGAAPVLTASGRALVFSNLVFRGDFAGSGDCLVTSGDNIVLDHCASWTNTGYALWAKGNGTRIIGTGDIYYSPDAAGAAIAIGVTGTNTLYAQIMGIATSTSAVGIKYFDHGASGISNCQLNTVDMTSGAAYVSNCRIVGNYIAKKSFNIIEGCTISGNVTLGDGVTSLSGIGFGALVFVQAGSTMTINTNIRDSVLNLEQIETSGVTVVDNLTGTATDVGNTIYTGERTYTPSWMAASVNPTLGNGTLVGKYTRTGRTVTDQITLTIGSTTANGTGEYTFTLSHQPKSSTKYSGAGVITDVGANLYVVTSRTKSDGTKNMAVFSNGVGTGVQQNSPMTWATGDTMEVTVNYPVI